MLRKLCFGSVAGLVALLASPAQSQDFTTSIHDSYSNNRAAIMGSHQAKLRAKKLRAYRAQRYSPGRGLTYQQLKQRQYERARLRDRSGY